MEVEVHVRDLSREGEKQTVPEVEVAIHVRRQKHFTSSYL
jgi:hypothetical protein